MKSRRLVVAVAVVAVCLVATACASNENMPIVEAENATDSGSVVAIRLSPQLSGINAGAAEGYVILVAEDGSAHALEAGAMDVGKVVWGDEGLFFAGPDNEYVLTENGLEAQPRGSEEAYETGRFLTTDQRSFISIYNVGLAEKAYVHRVTTGDATGIRSWDVEGLFTSLNQCGDTIVGITDITETTLQQGTRLTIDAADVEPGTDALVQLYPEPTNAKSSFLGISTTDGAFEQQSFDAPCVDGTAYALAFHFPGKSTASGGALVLRAWDITTGEHRVLPLLDAKGMVPDISFDDIMLNPGIAVGGSYTWATFDGRVYATDLATGVTSHLFQVKLTAQEAGKSQFFFTEDAVFVLDVGQDTDGDFELSRYNLETGERAHLLTVAGSGMIHDGLDMVVRDIAVKPEWVDSFT